jgi:D-glycero-D-manno-heptose 1,7-bisphosphate phosphatase
VPGVLRALTDAGYGLAIASNQPAFAKGKATMEELRQVHQRVLEDAQSAGAVILSSHICFHRAEDGCACRKPGVALLREAFARHPVFRIEQSWMVGDRATDVLAGAAFSLQTALLAGDGTADELAVLAGRVVRPSFCGDDLRDFGRFLLGNPR